MCEEPPPQPSPAEYDGGGRSKRKGSMIQRFFSAGIVGLFLLAGAALGAEPKLTLSVPFENSVDAAVAGGNGKGKFLGTPEELRFGEGLSGRGWLAGLNGQQVRYEGKGNIAPDQWTITFWVKGLETADWNKSEGGFQQFWGLDGEEGEILWFYKYNSRSGPWLFYRPRKGQGNARWLVLPRAPEKQWHFWAVSWRRGAGAYVYLDGRLVGQSPCVSPDPVKSIHIGGSHQKNQNKVFDRFQIYDAALSGGQIARLYYQQGDFALRPTLTVTPAKHKITIDGKIEPGEWDGAAGFAGLIDTGAWTIEPPATWGKITYDENNLYVLMHSDQPAKVKASPDTAAQHGLVKKEAVKHDQGVMSDDNFFICVRPSSSNGTGYCLAVNAIGTTTDFNAPPSQLNWNYTWESDAKVKSVVDMEGWTMETAIPLKSLGIDNTVSGATWGMNVGRAWKMLLHRIDEWSPQSRPEPGEVGLAMRLFFGPSLHTGGWSPQSSPEPSEAGLGVVRFVGNTQPSADLQQFEISPAGRVQAKLMVYRGSTASALTGGTKAETRSNSASEGTGGTTELTATLSAGDETIQQKQISLKMGESADVTFDAVPKDAAGKLIAVDVREGKQTILHQSAPFIPQQVGQLAMWSYPSRGQIRVGWVLQSGSDPKTLSLEAQLKNAAGEAALEKTVEALPSASGSTLLDVKALPDGKYTLAVQVKGKEGVVQQQMIPFEKQPLPEWLGNTLGISDTPPPPWTDVQVAKEKDAISVWGRTYEYAGRLLPEQIVNQGKAMLAGPMRLVVKGSDGKELGSAEQKAGSVQWTATSAVRADALRKQTIGPVTVEAREAVEFDGMAWMEMTVSAAHAGSATPPTGAPVGALTVEIPLKAEWAKLIRPYDDYKLTETGLLPPKGWAGKAMAMPWVGNADGGFQFFQETTASWIGSKRIEVIPDGKGAVVVRVHLIDAPAKLEKPLQFAFGWIASPVKAAPKDLRDWRCISAGPLVKNPKAKSVLGDYLIQAAALNPALRVYLPWWQGWWWLPGVYKGNPDLTGPVPVPAGNDAMNAVRDYHGIKLFGAPYGRLTEMGTANPWFAQFGDEWVPSPSKFTQDETAEPAKRIAHVSQASRSLRDFYAWGYARLLDEGDVHALYFDVSRPLNDTNVYHGAGVVMPDGSVEPTLNILGTRRTFQRIYTLLKQKHPEGRLFYHMSGETMLPVDSFCDAMVDGENYTGMLDRKENRGYEHVLSLDQFRTEYSAQNNFGPATVFLPEFGRSGAIKAEEWKELGYGHAEYLLGLMLAHDSNIWWTYFPQEVLAQAYGALDKVGWTSAWTFVPYWHQTAFKLPEGVVASLYRSPDKSKVVVVVMNVSGKDQVVDLPLSGEAFKGGAFKNASAIYPDEPVRLEGAEVRGLRVKQNNFRAILLK